MRMYLRQKLVYNGSALQQYGYLKYSCWVRSLPSARIAAMLLLGVVADNLKTTVFQCLKINLAVS